MNGRPHDETALDTALDGVPRSCETVDLPKNLFRLRQVAEFGG